MFIISLHNNYILPQMWFMLLLLENMPHWKTWMKQLVHFYIKGYQNLNKQHALSLEDTLVYNDYGPVTVECCSTN